MNYAELTSNIEDTVENTFTAAQLILFVQEAEFKIYQTVEIPGQRSTSTTNLSASSQVFSTPTGFLYPYSFAVIDNSGNRVFLLNKDFNFIREAYPDPTVEGLPKHYGIQTDGSFILGPTPDTTYTVELDYAKYPESIVTASTTWLGDNFAPALFDVSLVEAARFLKFEEDTVAEYAKQATLSMGLLKQFVDGKLRQDTYRSGQVRTKVS